MKKEGTKIRVNNNTFLQATRVLILFLSLLILIGPALYNGYPILFFDSGSYIFHGFIDEPMVTHPMVYAWLVRHISMAYTLWFVVIFQALIVFFLLHLLVRATLRSDQYWVITFLIVIILASTTGLSHYVSQIMPDIFLSIVLIIMFLLLTVRSLSSWKFYTLAVILILSATTHLSNLPLASAAFIGSVLIMYVANKKLLLKTVSRKGFLYVSILLLSAWLLVPSILSLYGEGFRFSRAGKAVWVSKLLTTGALQKYLHDHCPENPDYRYCKYESTIDRYTRMDYFLWEDDSFLYDHPCKEKSWVNCWTDRSDEFSLLIDDVLSYPPSRDLYLKQSLATAKEQFSKFSVITFDSFDVIIAPDYPIRHYMKDDVKNYEKSRQFHEKVKFPLINSIQKIAIPISLLIILLYFIFQPLRIFFTKDLRLFLLMVVITLLVNPLLIGFLGAAVGRFQGRIIWLIPLIALLLVIKTIRDKYQIFQGKEASADASQVG